MTGSDFLEKLKKVKNEIKGPEKLSFLLNLSENKIVLFLEGPVTSILKNFQFSQKCCDYIDPSGHFVFYANFFLGSIIKTI